MRKIHRIAIAAGALLTATIPLEAADHRDMMIVQLQVDSSDPVNGIVTMRDMRTGQAFSFRAPVSTINSLRLSQRGSMDHADQFATIGNQRFRVTPADPVNGMQANVRPTYAEPLNRPVGATASAASSPGVQCTRLNANGSASGSAVLTVNVNGQDVGTFDRGVYANLEVFMTPGPNTIRLTFSGPDPRVNGELRCLPPGQTISRTRILSLTPSASRLTAQTQVNLVGR